MHPRNRHTGHYDLFKLFTTFPELKPFVRRNPKGERTIDFANPAAVRALNAALLAEYYGTKEWKTPEGYLCPPIPGRSDYVHTMADLLEACNEGEIPRGDAVRVLDIGVGASAIYPIVGRGEYGWSFVGSDIDEGSVESARAIVEANDTLRNSVEIRLQSDRARTLEGVVLATDRFDIVMTNPPFHGSAEEAREGSERKWKNLGKAGVAGADPVLNFGGHRAELWCEGGEVAFILGMIEESRAPKYRENILVFSTLVSRVESLEPIHRALEATDAAAITTTDLYQGSKKSRVVAWTFHDEEARGAWAARHWPAPTPVGAAESGESVESHSDPEVEADADDSAN